MSLPPKHVIIGGTLALVFVVLLARELRKFFRSDRKQVPAPKRKACRHANSYLRRLGDGRQVGTWCPDCAEFTALTRDGE